MSIDDSRPTDEPFDYYAGDDGEPTDDGFELARQMDALDEVFRLSWIPTCNGLRIYTKDVESTIDELDLIMNTVEIEGHTQWATEILIRDL